MVRAPETSAESSPFAGIRTQISAPLGSDQLCTLLVADSGIIVCPCHYYLVSTLFQDIPKQKRNVQIQLILRETAEGTSGSGGSLGLHGGGTGAVRFCGAHINIFTLMSGIDSDDMAVVGSRRGVITAIGESFTTGFTENRGLGRFWLFSASGARSCSPVLFLTAFSVCARYCCRYLLAACFFSILAV